MKKNIIELKQVLLYQNKIDYIYNVYGDFEKVFNNTYKFDIEYSCDLSQLPIGIAVIPFLCNVLPIVWLYDATLIVNECDKNFYDCIENVKDGYKAMYPMLYFGGEIIVSDLISYKKDSGNGALVFFSGGVDAYNTLISHEEEKPKLLTLWGSDISLEDYIGWSKVENHVRQVAKEFETEYVTIRTSFRTFLKEGLLDERVIDSGDGWWHGFQHGMGLIGHAAPIAYLENKEVVYIASSFTVDDKVTCASDPSIDNCIKFSNCRVVHDGYEKNRQMKLRQIVGYSKQMKKKIELRVCWISKGGDNCCNCEKCWRTMLGIYAEKEEPRKFGFNYSDLQFRRTSNRIKKGTITILKDYRKPLYLPIQMAMQKNLQKKELPRSIRWFYDVDISTISNASFFNRVIIKIKEKIANILLLI